MVCGFYNKNFISKFRIYLRVYKTIANYNSLLKRKQNKASFIVIEVSGDTFLLFSVVSSQDFFYIWICNNLFLQEINRNL